jgi:hypothetical protein
MAAFACAAFVALRAHAARKSNSQVGLFFLFRRRMHEWLVWQTLPFAAPSTNW